MYPKVIKPFIDVVVAMIVLVLLSPVIVYITLLLCIANNGRPFFFQNRIGLHNKPFKVIKFKTMNDKRGADGQLLPDADRLSPIGRFVRKTSLDELPQLINVLKRDMSLIGPRPLLPEYVPLYSKDQIRRHEVMPGITGWAQVNGRNAISWKLKFEYDVWYVDNISLKLDLRIVWMTLYKVVKSDGINSSTAATMEKFTGK